ncbi:MAG: hypothetical protein SWY16_00515 [Cyanobacteriota bacterium]|nr:hypothetical protein [Cyanobacteriota bacterium]
MNSNFLKAADRGRSRFKHYALALLWIVVGLFGMSVISTLPILAFRSIPGQYVEESGLVFLSCTSQLLFASFIYVSIAFILLFVTFKIHQRSPKTLINIGENIRFRRAIDGFFGWFLLRSVSSFLLFQFFSDRYALTDVAKIDLSVIGFGLIVSFSASLLAFISIAYVLQGTHQLVKNPFLLVLGWIFVATLILILTKQQFNLFSILLGTLNALLWLFILLKEEGIELNVGWLAADIFYSVFCVSTGISGLHNILSQCPSLIIARPVSQTIGIPLYIVQAIVFYYLLFVYPSKKI